MLGVFVGQIAAKELSECLSGVLAEASISEGEVLLPRFSLLGEPDLAPSLYSETT